MLRSLADESRHANQKIGGLLAGLTHSKTKIVARLERRSPCDPRVDVRGKGLRGRAGGRRRRNLQAIGSDSLRRAGTRLDSDRQEMAAEAWAATRPSPSRVVWSRIPRSGSDCATPRVGREKNGARASSSHISCEGRGSQPGRKWGPAPRKAPHKLKTLLKQASCQAVLKSPERFRPAPTARGVPFE